MYFINELRRSGASRREIEHIRTSHERVGWGAYCEPLTDDWQRYRAKCVAALERLQPSAYLAGPSAAAAWGLPLIGAAPQEVWVGGIPRGTYRSQLRVAPGAANTAELDGLAVADPAWTVIGCARLLPRRESLIVADAALHSGLCSRADLRALGAQLRGTVGIAHVRWTVDNSDSKSESPGETWTRMVLTDLGYDVTSQLVVEDGDFRARIDFAIDGQAIAVEFDGLPKYGDVRTTVVQEKSRQAQLEAHGYRVLRVLWHQLSDPHAIDRRIRAVGGRPVRRPSLANS